jgi:transcriptional regulator with XRE-family HTH domain
MVAYFESENGNPPLPILRKFVKALGVSADQLLGLEKVTARKKPRDTRLQQRFSQVEKLPEAEKKDVARYLDKVIRLAKLEQTKP